MRKLYSFRFNGALKIIPFLCFCQLPFFSPLHYLRVKNMKFLLEFVACCGSRRPAEDTRLLVMQEPRRRVPRKQDRARGSGREWQPSLTSISEDVLTAEKSKIVQRPPAEGWQRSLKRKVASMSQRDRPRRSSDHDDYRIAQIASVIPTFSPAPFMF